MLTIERIILAVDRTKFAPAQFTPDHRHCAVALVLAYGRHELEACFIRRTEQMGDPWSGQVALPGGRAGATDVSASAVAERETYEEIGLKLKPVQRIGALPTHAIRANMTLSPFIYYVRPLQNEAPPQQVATARDLKEVASVFWVPLSHMFTSKNITTLDYPQSGMPTTFPGIRFEDHVIWGLTLSVLKTFAQLVDQPLPALD
jgi:8-oxo-dGTP pyrophosphatase MutT (NUDIX family)